MDPAFLWWFQPIGMDPAGMLGSPGSMTSTAVDHTANGVGHRLIRPGPRQTNGKVEQVQNTILRELRHPTFTTYNEPSISGLRADLADYLRWYNRKRPHTGRWNQAKPPTQIVEPNTGNYP
jgi:transposase InsO family protein